MSSDDTASWWVIMLIVLAIVAIIVLIVLIIIVIVRCFCGGTSTVHPSSHSRILVASSTSLKPMTSAAATQTIVKERSAATRQEQERGHSERSVDRTPPPEVTAVAMPTSMAEQSHSKSRDASQGASGQQPLIDGAHRLTSSGSTTAASQSSEKRRPLRPIPSEKEPTTTSTSRSMTSSLKPVYGSQMRSSGVATPSAVSVVAASGQGLMTQRPEVVREDDEMSQDDGSRPKMADIEEVQRNIALIDLLPDMGDTSRNALPGYNHYPGRNTSNYEDT